MRQPIEIATKKEGIWIMYENIVNVTTSKIKEVARGKLSGRWKEFAIGCLIYYILSQTAQDILGVFFGVKRTIDLGEFSYEQFLNYGGGIYQIILGGALALGYAMFALVFFRTSKTDNSLLFEGFSHFGKATLLNILISIFTALWFFLFIIPGIVALYRYRMAYYVMIDHPEYSVIQCIRESKRLMKGNKGRLFGLDLSFIGWFLLALIPAILVGFYFSATSVSVHPITNVLITTVLALPSIAVMAYMKTSEVAFYQLATGRLVVVDETQGQYGYGNMYGGSNGYNGTGGYNGYNGNGGNGGYQGQDNNGPSDNQGDYPQEQNFYPPRQSNATRPRRDIDEEPDNSRDLD